MPNYSQIFRSMVCSDAGMVFIEGYIQTIMETILNSPMLTSLDKGTQPFVVCDG